MRNLLLPLAVLAAPATAQDWGDPAAVWRLASLDGAPFLAEATLSFPEPGKLAGKAPCNRISGSIDGPPAAFTLGPIAATRMACPALAAESAYLQALQSMQAGVLSGRLLILTDGQSRYMVFARD